MAHIVSHQITSQDTTFDNEFLTMNEATGDHYWLMVHLLQEYIHQQPSLPSLATPPSSPPSNSTRNFRVYVHQMFNMAIYKIIVTCIDRGTVLCTSISKPKLSELQMKSLVDMQDTAPSICNATVCYIANTNKFSV